jgi:hypothetical protein
MLNFSGRGNDNSILGNTQSNKLLSSNFGITRRQSRVASLTPRCNNILVAAPDEFGRGSLYAALANPALHHQNFRGHSASQRKEAFSVGNQPEHREDKQHE